MRLRRRVIAYLAGVHLVMLALAVTYAGGQLAMLFGLEALIALSFAGGVLMLRRTLEPIDYARRLRELLQEREYAVRLRGDDVPELAALVEEFNALLSALHNERLRLGEQQGFLDRLLEATPSAVIVFDFDGRVTLLNASAQALPGMGEAMEKTLAQCGTGLPARLDALPLGESRLFTAEDGRRFRGQRGSFFDRGFARHFLLVEELTEELESSERATYEKLIRVLAHEVNNTVAATGSVLGSLLHYGSQLRDEDRGDYGTAIDAVRRRNASLGEFIERFTQVVKMPAPQLREHDLGGVVDDVLALYREHARQSGVSLGWRQRAALPPLVMDRAQMEQALVNVVKNAIEAAQAGPEPRWVEVELTPERLSVMDSGAELKVDQLFTPFYSTKKGGQGIGLMLVREVLLRNGFAFRLASDGACTRFDIWKAEGQARGA